MVRLRHDATINAGRSHKREYYMEQMTGLSSIERQELIFRTLKEQKRINLTEISEVFGISTATARRDLDMLAEQGKAQRVHGGAILSRKAPPEMAVTQRQVEQAEDKQRIGLAAAQMIADGETVFISSGTTALEVAKRLTDRQSLTVITNSLPVLNTFSSNPNISVICLGGNFRHSEASYIGHLTEGNLEEVRADKVIFGIRGISLEEGLTNDYMPETSTDRMILKTGREIIIVADHTKFDRVSTVFVAPLTSIHTIVTDKTTPHEFLDGLRTKGIRVVVA
jgi:DeoR family transcriptional regulator, aga operon transcriptional repressor